MTENKNLKILFIGKQDDYYSRAASDFVRLHFNDPIILFSKREDPMPDQLNKWKGDLLISYLSQWVIPKQMLENAIKAAVNFHPGSPEYPGIGCTNFAIYNEEKQYGITCHHMLTQVDAGPIIAVRRFPVLENDTVYSLTQRCYIEILHLFLELITGVLKGKELPFSNESWKRRPYKRKDLDKLCELTPEMSAEEINKRLKATTFGDKIWAYMKIGEQKLEYQPGLK